MAQFLRVFFVLTALLLASAAHRSRRIRLWVKRPVNAVGRVTCDGEPMSNVLLRLMRKRNAQIGYARTDENGNFNISGKLLLRNLKFNRFRGRASKKFQKFANRFLQRGTPKPFINVVYSHKSVNGSLKVLGIVARRNRKFAFVRRESSAMVPYNSSGIDFGTINFASIHCRAYTRFYEALQLFHTRAPTLTLPYRTLFVKTGTYDDTPRSTIRVIRIPKMFQNITTETANHEFAHTFRQGYDGNFTHFKSDEERFNYTLRQACGNQSNEGNAFNEGWAEYWADSCNGSYGNDTQDYTIEGNVANGLRALQSNCTSTFYQMVNVLKQNKEIIHSFQSFNDQHGMLYNCTLSV